MNVSRLQQFMSDYGRALGELEEAASWTDIDKPHRDSTILRFVLVYEVTWKTLMFALAEVGPEVDTARDAFRQAYRQHWINDENLWLGMIRDRNLVTHTYREATAVAVYERIKGYVSAYRNTYDLLKEEFANPPT